MKKIFICFYSIIILLSACESKPKSDAQSTTTEENHISKPSESVRIPKFNRNSAYAYIQKQMSFGPRVPGTEAHIKTKNYLTHTLEQYFKKVIVQDFTATTYDGETYTGYNIFGSYKPQLKHRILLGAHWDSRKIADHDTDEADRLKAVPGANDGASGVGILLEIARILSENEINLGVDIVFFDLEDQGKDKGNAPLTWCLGAQHFGKNLPRNATDYQAGILLDMVGAENAQFGKEGFSMKYAPEYTKKVWALADAMGYGNLFIQKNVGAVTDDHYFINQLSGIPMIDIIDKRDNTNGFFPHWHTTEDDMQAIDKGTIRAVGQVVTAVLYKTYNGDF